MIATRLPRVTTSGALLGIAGSLSAGFAGWQSGTLASGFAWTLAMLVACLGFGTALDRICGYRTSLGVTIVSGLACLVVLGTALATAGQLTVGVQLGMVMLGVLLASLHRSDGPPMSRALLAFVVVAGVFLLAIALIRMDLVISGGANHGYAVKRQWDLGSFGWIHHQLGAQLVGESFFALTRGAHAAGIYELAIACTLVLLTVAGELGRPRRETTVMALFFLVAVPIVFGPKMTPQWSGVLFHLAAFAALQRAIAARRVGVHTIMCALALAMSRHELVVIAVPYLAAAIALPRGWRGSPRSWTVCILGWIAILVALQVGLTVPLWQAVLNGGLILLALPLTWCVLRVAWRGESRGAIAVLCFGTLSSALAVGIWAIRPLQHDVPASFAVWLGASLCVMPALGTSLDSGGPLRAPAAYAITVLLLGFMLVEPTLENNDRYIYFRRLEGALYALEQRAVRGDELGPHLDVRRLQELVPVRARLGFFGQHGAALDFRRNRLRELSWPVARSRRDERFLTPLAAPSLRGVDQLIVEGVLTHGVGEDEPSWDRLGPPAIAEVEDMLELRACVGAACLYEVRR